MILKKNGKCVPEDGHYLPEEEENVKECHKTCRRCIGPNNNQCKKCYKNFTLTD